MKKKISPFLFAGFLSLLIGGILQIVFRFVDVAWDYGLLTLCINVLTIILFIVGIYKTIKANKE